MTEAFQQLWWLQHHFLTKGTWEVILYLLRKNLSGKSSESSLNSLKNPEVNHQSCFITSDSSDLKSIFLMIAK